MKAALFLQLAAVTLWLASCGGSSPTPPAPGAEAERPAVQASAQAASAGQPDDPRVVCPVGTTQRLHEGFGIRMVWCEDTEGRHHGPKRKWWSNGRLAEEMSYVHGLLEGRYSGWYEDGAREVERGYLAGKLHGRALGWHSNGRKALESVWQGGVLVGAAKRWDDKGRPEPVKEK